MRLPSSGRWAGDGDFKQAPKGRTRSLDGTPGPANALVPPHAVLHVHRLPGGALDEDAVRAVESEDRVARAGAHRLADPQVLVVRGQVAAVADEVRGDVAVGPRDVPAAPGAPAGPAAGGRVPGGEVA